MKLAIALSALLLQGCYQSVNKLDIELASQRCGGIEKVYEVSAGFTGHERVTCADGRRFALVN